MSEGAPVSALAASTVVALGRAQIASACSGWELKSVEIDQVNARARIEVSRAGRHVILDIQPDSASVSRESWVVEQAVVCRRGDRSIVDRVTPRFLGRMRFVDVRAALHYFADYIEGNGNGQLVGQEAFQLLLGQ